MKDVNALLVSAGKFCVISATRESKTSVTKTVYLSLQLTVFVF